MQTTLEREVYINGVGIHTGSYTQLIIKPAPPDTGIIFYQDGLPIPATVENVYHTKHGVTLKMDGKEIKTCEHLLSALYGLGIDNATCEVYGEEIPVLDGSSLEFATRIKVKPMDAKDNVMEIREPLFLGKGDAQIFVIPHNEFKITFIINYAHPGIKLQYASFVISQPTYLKEIAPARTYAFIDWIDTLRRNGLIKGGNFTNAVVIGKDGPLNKVRFKNEQVRHKILDLIGDLALLGKRIKGWIFCIKSGHTLNIELVRRLKWNLM